jgi:hypothetical protein
MSEFTTTSTVIDALGGNTAVADLTGSNPKAVWNWRGFTTFPSNTYVVMIAALEAKGMSAPASLWGMRNTADQAPAHGNVA